MSPLSGEVRPLKRHWTDDWNGYPAARQRLLDQLRQTRAANPVILSGDIHAFGAAQRHAAPADPASPLVAAEFVATSISSQGPDEALVRTYVALNPTLQFADGTSRGYLRLDITPASLRTDMVRMDTVRERTSGSSVVASFDLSDGQPDLIRR